MNPKIAKAIADVDSRIIDEKQRRAYLRVCTDAYKTFAGAAYCGGRSIREVVLEAAEMAEQQGGRPAAQLDYLMTQTKLLFEKYSKCRKLIARKLAEIECADKGLMDFFDKNLRLRDEWEFKFVP